MDLWRISNHSTLNEGAGRCPLEHRRFPTVYLAASLLKILHLELSEWKLPLKV